MKYLGEAIGIALVVLMTVFFFDPIKLGHNARLVYDSFMGWAPCVEDALACFRTGEVRN